MRKWLTVWICLSSIFYLERTILNYMQTKKLCFHFQERTIKLLKWLHPTTVACGVQSCCGRGPDKTEKYLYKRKSVRQHQIWMKDSAELTVLRLCTGNSLTATQFLSGVA